MASKRTVGFAFDNVIYQSKRSYSFLKCSMDRASSTFCPTGTLILLFATPDTSVTFSLTSSSSRET